MSHYHVHIHPHDPQSLPATLVSSVLKGINDSLDGAQFRFSGPAGTIRVGASPRGAAKLRDRDLLHPDAPVPAGVTAQ